MKPAKVQQLFILGSDVIEGVSRPEVVATYQDMLTLGIANPPVDLFDLEMSGLSYVKLCDDGLEILNNRLRSVIDERTRIENMTEDEQSQYKRDVEAELAKLNRTADEEAQARAYRLGLAKGQILGAREAVERSERTGDMSPHHAKNLREMKARISYRRDPETGEIECGAVVKLLDGSVFTKLEARQLIRDVEYDPIGYAYCVLIVLLATRNVIRDTTISKSARLGIGKNRYPYTTTLKLGTIHESVGNGAPGHPRRPHLRRGHIRNQKYGPGFEFTRQRWIEPCFVNAADGWIEQQRTAYNVSRSKPAQQEKAS